MDSVRASIGPALADRYSIEQELGSGAMALVFLAHDLKHDRWVAIKVLKPDVASAIGGDRFHREIEVVARLTHPHILPLYDSGQAAGLLYFVMPHVEGESLRERLTREDRVPIAEATRIGREIADALDFAHEHGVVHRDVKPGNIMLSAGHAQLADFGIAHLVEGAEATLTGTGITVGTPAYMSPEQVSGDEALDGRSDIYSLGCVLYEMLCGRPPFNDGSRRAVLVHQMMDTPRDIRGDCPEVPLELVGVIKKSLEKEPKKRFDSAKEMSKALASVRSDIDVTVGAQIRRALKRRGRRLKIWQRVALVTLIVLAAIGAPMILNEVFRPVPEVTVAYPTYALLPVVSEGQTEREKDLVMQAHRDLCNHLRGWELVTVLDGLMLEGAAANVAQAGFGLPVSSVDAGVRFAQGLQASHLVYLDARASGNSVRLSAIIHVIPERRPRETLLADGPADEVALVAADIALQLLQIEGEPADLEQLRSRSPNPQAHHNWEDGWSMLLDWRLAEAEAFFREAIELDPEFALAHYHLALTMYWRTVRDPERILDGESIHRHVMLADRYGNDERLRFGERRDVNAFKAFWQGNYAAARAQYSAILQQEPNRLDALVLAGAVEVEDPWLVTDDDGNAIGPRGDLNHAIAVFDTAVALNRHVQLAWGQLFEIERDVATTAYRRRRCYGYLPPGGDPIKPYEFPEAADVQFFCPYVEDGAIHWRPDSLTALQAERAVAEVGALRDRIENRLRAWSGIWVEQARPHEELADRLLWERSARGCDTDAELAASLLGEARSHTEQALVLRGDTTPEDRLRLAALLLATGATARAEAETSRALEELGDWRTGRGTPPPELAANVYLALGQGAPAAEILEVVSGHSTWAVDDTISAGGAIPGGAVYGTLKALYALGITGGDSAGIADRFAEVRREWDRMGYSEREKVILRARTTSMVGAALLLQPKLWSGWFSDWHLADEAIPAVWRGFMTLRERPDEARDRLLDAVSELEAKPAGQRRAIHYYMPIQLAERLGDDATVTELVERAATCPLGLDNIDFGWGMRRYLAGHERF